MNCHVVHVYLVQSVGRMASNLCFFEGRSEREEGEGERGGGVREGRGSERERRGRERERYDKHTLQL